MAIMISEDKKDLAVTCKCGCDNGIHISIDNESFEDDYIYHCFTNGNFYKEQYEVFETLKNKVKKIWAIIRNKDYYYSDIVMAKEEFEQFKKWINQF